MLRLYQSEHFDFQITHKPGDYLKPDLSVKLKPEIQAWLDEHNADWRFRRQDEDNDTYLVIVVDIELDDPQLEMLFKLTWL